MILCDTSMIVALIRADDQDHRRCTDLMSAIRVQIVTTWPCITEAMYLVKPGAGQETLSQMIETGFFRLFEPTQEHAMRACSLMRQYADAPMDFADASLVVTAESLTISRILTLDSHFHAYRINGKTPFEVLP